VEKIHDQKVSKAFAVVIAAASAVVVGGGLGVDCPEGFRKLFVGQSPEFDNVWVVQPGKHLGFVGEFRCGNVEICRASQPAGIDRLVGQEMRIAIAIASCVVGVVGSFVRRAGRIEGRRRDRGVVAARRNDVDLAILSASEMSNPVEILAIKTTNTTTREGRMVRIDRKGGRIHGTRGTKGRQGIVVFFEFRQRRRRQQTAGCGGGVR